MKTTLLIWIEKSLENSFIDFSENEIRLIIGACSKSIAKSVEYVSAINSWYKIYTCPRCKKPKFITNNIQKYPKYCENCGQKLRWKSFKKAEKEC